MDIDACDAATSPANLRNANGKYKYRGGITLSRYRPHYLTRAPLYLWALHMQTPPATWRPTRAPTWTRVVVWPPATWSRPVRLLRLAWATHGSATWPQRRVASVRWSRAPRISSPLSPLATSASAGKLFPFSRF